MAGAFVTSTEYKEWQRPLSGIYFIMMEKLTQTGDKVVVYAPAERADTLPLFLLDPYMYSVVTSINNTREEILTESPVSLIPVKTLGVRNNIHYTC
jgi:hypothetical protein